MLGSLAPDIDVVLALRGMDVYLRAHERGTHAFVGTPIEGAAVAGLLSLLLRGTRARFLFLAAWIELR